MKKFAILMCAVLGMVKSSFSLVANVGSTSTVESVKAYDIDQYQQRFIGNYDAGVWISGDGSTDLDLYIYDGNGNLVCRSEASGDDEYCVWKPIWTGSFTIRIKNRGSVWNQYTIIIR